jgi:hypothetical protein
MSVRPRNAELEPEGVKLGDVIWRKEIKRHTSKRSATFKHIENAYLLFKKELKKCKVTAASLIHKVKSVPWRKEKTLFESYFL